MYDNEEHEHYKRNDFVYCVVDIDHALKETPEKFDDIWFEPVNNLLPDVHLDEFWTNLYREHKHSALFKDLE